MKRHLINFDTSKIKKEYSDVLIIGSGIAGLYTALNIDSKYKVKVISKSKALENNSNLAQGGIAACLSSQDNIRLHYEDTLRAGSFYNDKKAVNILVNEAPSNISQLIKIGTNFDRDKDGGIKLTKEGGHSQRRILHCKDQTGKEIIRALLNEVKRRKNIELYEDTFAIDIITNKNMCTGALIEKNNEENIILSKAVVISTGGIGQVYKNTTNSIIATGDGIAMAYRAGANIKDMEFVQFHPTALYSEGDRKRFLISEAVRGEGAILRNTRGNAFMEDYHELKDLAPRDIVSRAIFKEMNREGKPYVLLDITHKDSSFIKNRFPNIYKICLDKGSDMTKDYIPVCPVQHYIMGGIETDYKGRTNIKGLYACGEAASTGVHGANRLASNSLLEGIVFGKRVAEDINYSIESKPFDNYSIEVNIGDREGGEEITEKYKEIINETMNKYVFILRSKVGLKKALNKIKETMKELERYKLKDRRFYECINIVTVASLIVKASLDREESIGSYSLIDNLEV